MDSLPISDVFSIPLADIPVDGMQNPVNERMFETARRANQFIIPQTKLYMVLIVFLISPSIKSTCQ